MFINIYIIIFVIMANENNDKGKWWWFSDDFIVIKQASDNIRGGEDDTTSSGLNAQSFCRLLTIVGVTKIDFAINYILQDQLKIIVPKNTGYACRLKLIFEKTITLHNFSEDEQNKIINNYRGLKEFRNMIIHANRYISTKEKIQKLKDAELLIDMQQYSSWDAFDKVYAIIDKMTWAIDSILVLKEN